VERNRILKKYYLGYVDSLRKHINDEEVGIFPYSLEAEDVALGLKAEISQPFSGFTVSTFEGEHFNVENAITDLKNIIVRFLKPDYDLHLCHEFLTWLTLFERDIVNHARIEDHILVGKVKCLEEQFKR
jgi:regulator of cell morphogenesis and NO signaling